MLRERINPHKRQVAVRAEFRMDGRVVPLSFTTPEGERVKIDRVLEQRQAASLKSGGCGIRYLCRVRGLEMYLFHDRDEWFVEDAQ